MAVLLEVPRQPVMPQNGSFSGHETFPFRYAWLKKGIEGLLQQPDIFNRDDAMVTLGVGKNMVRAIRHWCLATQVVAEGDFHPNTRSRVIATTPIGRALFVDPAWDSYLEDDGSLWLLHWLLANNPERATTCFWAFNILKEQEFTRESLNTALEHVRDEFKYRVSDTSLKNDASCFMRTYVAAKRGPTSTVEETLDCPLTNLGLLIDLGENRYRFNNGPKPGLADEVFIYALLDFWDQWHPGQETLSLREITYGVGSPGRIFKLNDDAVLGYLDEIAVTTHGKLRFSDTVMLRQVVRHETIVKEDILDAYYTQ